MAMTFGIWCPIHSGGWAKREATGVQDDAWDIAKDLTLYAESLGFEYELIAARWYGPVLESYSTTAALAAITSKIKLIVAVHSGLVQPQIVAKIGANIDQISGGRFHINLVSGNEAQMFQQEMYGGIVLPHDERYALSDEFIRVIKGIWQEQPYTFSGKYYNITDADMRPKPVQKPRPTIFLGGFSEPARELAAKECDWYFISGRTLEEAIDLRRDILARAAKYDRTVRFALSILTLIRDTDKEAEHEVAVLREQAEHDPTVHGRVLSLRPGIWGRPERVAERLAEFSRAGFELTLIDGSTLKDDIRQFGEQVAPMLSLAAGPPNGDQPQYLTIE